MEKGFKSNLVSEQQFAAMAEVYIKGQQKALTDLIDFDKISEQDLKDILVSELYDDERHSESSDAARK